MAQSQHKQNQTETVTGETDYSGAKNDRCLRQDAALCQRERKIDGPGNQALDKGNLYRVRSRQLARQIIVDAPGEARAGDCQGSPTNPEAASLPRPGQQSCACQDGKRAQE